MVDCSVTTEDLSGRDHEGRNCEKWLTALSDGGVDGSHKRRSNSGHAVERIHHPHINHIFSQPPNNLKPQPLEISKKGNAQGVRPRFPGTYPNEPPRLSLKSSTEKDVDDCRRKMRETSGFERKRKTHQHSSDLVLSTEPEEVFSARSTEEIAVQQPSIEHEGVATSCKRIKLGTSQDEKFQHNDIVETFVYTGGAAVTPVGELKEPPDHLALDSDPTLENVDGEAREQKTFTGNRNVAKREALGGKFFASYDRPSSHRPDYGPQVVQNATQILHGRNGAMTREKKATDISGAFRPVNRLRSSNTSSAVLSRPHQKKAFDLHEGTSYRAPHELPAAKRQKVGAGSSVRRESSGSIDDLSGDNNRSGRRHNPSSTISTPKKLIQSISSRSLLQNQPFVSKLGEVPEYLNTESMMSCFTSKRKRRKAVFSGSTRRMSLRGATEDDSRHSHILLTSESPVSVDEATQPKRGNGLGRNPILVDDLESEVFVVLSEGPKSLMTRTRSATPRSPPNKLLTSAEESLYFAKPDKPIRSKDDAPHAAASRASPQCTYENLEIGEEDSSNSFYTTADESQHVEDDSVDLVETDGHLGRHLKAESDAKIEVDAKHSEAPPISNSISEAGNIPRTKFTASRSETNQNQTSRMLKPEPGFDIIYMQSGLQILDVAEDVVTWQLQYSNEKKGFDILANGESSCELDPRLMLKPEKVHHVKYSTLSRRVVISRAMEPSIGAAGQFLIGFGKVVDGNRFAQYLKRLNHTIALCPCGRGEELDRVFATARISTGPLARQQDTDTALLEVKEARRATAKQKSGETAMGTKTSRAAGLNQSANMRREHSSSAEQVNSIQIRKRSIANRMQPDTLSNASPSSRIPQVVLPARKELLSSNLPSNLNRDQFYDSRPATRASLGQWNGARQLQALKSRSHSPVRWTDANPNWKENRSWKSSLTFPKEGKKRATVDARDIERLDEGEFLNDNLIEFYLLYLEIGLQKSQPELARRIYFHNTFFYKTLTQGKVRSNNINYDAVKRWTSKVDLFSYDYIVVPVCEKLHWYVAIICNAPRLLQVDVPEPLEPQSYDGCVTLPLEAINKTTLEEPSDDAEAPDLLGISAEAAESTSASTSVVVQVEHMSLEDQDQEWPEPDAVPVTAQLKIAPLPSLPTTDEYDNDPLAEHGLRKHSRIEDSRPNGKKLKRKSIPPSRKYDPGDPRIITLDSLGQAHSPTCSNLKEYLRSEAKERHDAAIAPNRLGMTAKGLPQQSNYCDCGVFVLGYVEKFLNNPDEFVGNLLQGDVTEDKRIKIEAPQIRIAIRELIFRLQAGQFSDEKVHRDAKSKGKKTPDTKSKPKVSGKPLDDEEQQPFKRQYSDAAGVETELIDSNSTEIVIRPVAPSMTRRVGNRSRFITPEHRRHSYEAIDDHEIDPVEETDPYSIGVLQEKSSTYFSHRASSPDLMTYDNNIMEPLAQSVEHEPSLPENMPTSRNGDGFSPPNSINTSVQLDSPLRSTPSESKQLSSPNPKEEARHRRDNVFKSFGKELGSPPSRNTRQSQSRQDEVIEHNTLEIHRSQEILDLEVAETPPRRSERGASFDDIMEMPSRSPKPKSIILDVEQSPEIEVISPSRSLRRKLNPRH